MRIQAEFAQVSVRKTVAARIEPFAQVQIVRILGVCGEVAERLKAAVCCPSPLLATPQFARTYRVDCSYCHSALRLPGVTERA